MGVKTKVSQESKLVTQDFLALALHRYQQSRHPIDIQDLDSAVKLEIQFENHISTITIKICKFWIAPFLSHKCLQEEAKAGPWSKCFVVGVDCSGLICIDIRETKHRYYL